MEPGALEPKFKEMLYVAVSIAHGCTYCIHSHTASARAKGMTDQEYAEMIAIVGWPQRQIGLLPRWASPLTTPSLLIRLKAAGRTFYRSGNALAVGNDG
jgi:AhpD family alkylhydroperoxidase